MSFSTTAYLTLNDGDKAALIATRDEIAAYLTEQALSQDVLKDLEQAFGMHGISAPAVFNLDPERIPSLSFEVNGIGDLGPGDIWARDFVNGVTVFEAGPFEDKIYC